MIIQIKQGNATFTTSAALLFGLRKEEAMNKYPVTVQEMDRVSKEIGLTTGYNDTAMKQICLIKRLGFEVDLAMYEHEVKNINAKIDEAAADNAEAATVIDWIGDAAEIAEKVGAGQKSFVEDMGDSYEYHLSNEFTQPERDKLHQWWNDKYSLPPYSATEPIY